MIPWGVCRINQTHSIHSIISLEFSEHVKIKCPLELYLNILWLLVMVKYSVNCSTHKSNKGNDIPYSKPPQLSMNGKHSKSWLVIFVNVVFKFNYFFCKYRHTNAHRSPELTAIHFIRSLLAMKQRVRGFLQMTFHFTKCTISEQQNDSRKERPSCSFVHVADFCNTLDML